jgi:hypothetical protein
MKAARVPDDVRQAILRDYAAGIPTNDIATRYGVSPGYPRSVARDRKLAGRLPVADDISRDSARRPLKANEARTESANELAKRAANVHACTRELAALIHHHPELFSPPPSATHIGIQVLKMLQAVQ